MLRYGISVEIASSKIVTFPKIVLRNSNNGTWLEKPELFDFTEAVTHEPASVVIPIKMIIMI